MDVSQFVGPCRADTLAWSVWGKRSQMGCLDVARARGAGEEPHVKGMNIQLFWCEWHGISRHLVTWLGPEMSVIPQDIPIVLWTVMIQHEILGLLYQNFRPYHMFFLFICLFYFLRDKTCPRIPDDSPDYKVPRLNKEGDRQATKENIFQQIYH